MVLCGCTCPVCASWKWVRNPRRVHCLWQVAAANAEAALLLCPWLAPSRLQRTFKNVLRCHSCTVYNSVFFSIQARLNPQRTLWNKMRTLAFTCSCHVFTSSLFYFGFPVRVSHTSSFRQKFYSLSKIYIFWNVWQLKWDKTVNSWDRHEYLKAKFANNCTHRKIPLKFKFTS